jgi:hypothetical protein
MTPEDILLEAAALIEDPAHWLTGTLESDGRYCAVGALYAVGDGHPQALHDAEAFLEDAARRWVADHEPSDVQLPIESDWILCLNDEIGHAAVKDCFVLALRLALAQARRPGRLPSGVFAAGSVASHDRRTVDSPMAATWS